MRRGFTLPAALLAGALVLAACSGKATDTGGGGGGNIETGTGVTADTITLAALTDLTGPFKVIGKGTIAGHKLWVEDVNSAGGICNRQIKLKVVDMGYDADTALAVYPQIESSSLGFIQLLGSPINAVLDPRITEDEMTAVALSWSSFILDTPYVIIPGTTYDVEMIDAMAYAMQEGFIEEGDTVGHIYISGEYGENGLLGSRYFAKQHDITINAVKVTATDTNMQSIVTELRSAGVSAILLTTTPAQSRSVLSANQALNLDVPVLGNNPTFSPIVLELSEEALDNFYIAASSVPFSSNVPKAQEVAKTFKEGNFEVQPNYGVPYGYAIGLIWEQLLKKACDAGALTREQIQKAVQSSTSIDTQELTAELDFSVEGGPATRQVYISKPDKNLPGGQKQITDLFVAPEAKEYVAPHQK